MKILRLTLHLFIIIAFTFQICVKKADALINNHPSAKHSLHKDNDSHAKSTWAQMVKPVYKRRSRNFAAKLNVKVFIGQQFLFFTPEILKLNYFMDSDSYISPLLDPFSPPPKNA